MELKVDWYDGEDVLVAEYLGVTYNFQGDWLVVCSDNGDRDYFRSANISRIRAVTDVGE